MSITIRAEEWKSLAGNAWREQETRITKFDVDWEYDQPIGDISYYPESNRLTYESENGPCVVTAYGNMLEEGGTQCCISNDCTGEKQQSEIYLNFVRPNLPTQAKNSELDDVSASTGDGGLVGTKGSAVASELIGQDGRPESGDETLGWADGSFIVRKNRKPVRSSAISGDGEQAEIVTIGNQSKKLVFITTDSASRSKAEKAMKREREATQQWRAQRKRALAFAKGESGRRN